MRVSFRKALGVTVSASLSYWFALNANQLWSTLNPGEFTDQLVLFLWFIFMSLSAFISIFVSMDDDVFLSTEEMKAKWGEDYYINKAKCYCESTENK